MTSRGFHVRNRNTWRSLADPVLAGSASLSLKIMGDNMSKKITQQQGVLNFDSQIFLETQEDFVFSREVVSKNNAIDCEDREVLLEDLIEVERMLKEISPAV
jgi:hypothetical protein